MKIALCVSNRELTVKQSVLRLFEKRVFKKSYEWHEKFRTYMDNYDLNYELVNIDKSDWIDKIGQFDVVVWKPEFMGIKSSQILKEKVFFMQHIMKKRVFPNYETIWHFDSKIAQSYLLKYFKIKTPKTFVSFEYDDVIENAYKFKYPIVVKESNGAGSTGVKLIKDSKKLISYVNYKFLWENLFSRKVNSKLYDRFGQVYIQEFLKGNDSDLRITIIGDKYAYGFWRKNRDNDFRASGSGKIDYVKNIPTNVIKYCSKISKLNKFDSMAYDILYKGDEFLIIEISYGYNDKALYNTKGYYELDDEGEVLHYTEGNFWPQELWVKWIDDKCVISKKRMCNE